MIDQPMWTTTLCLAALVSLSGCGSRTDADMASEESATVSSSESFSSGSREFSFSSTAESNLTFSSSGDGATFTSPGNSDSGTSSETLTESFGASTTPTIGEETTEGPQPANDSDIRLGVYHPDLQSEQRVWASDATQDSDPIFDLWHAINIESNVPSTDVWRVARYGTEIWWEQWNDEAGRSGDGRNCFREKSDSNEIIRDGDIYRETRGTQEIFYDEATDMLGRNFYRDGELFATYFHERTLVGTAFRDLPLCDDQTR